MPSNLQTGKNTVTGSVTVDPAASAGTVLMASTSTTTTNVTLVTVPADKVACILTADVSLTQNAGDSGTFTLSIQANGNNIIGVTSKNPTTSGGNGAHKSLSWTFPDCPRVAATQVIRTNNVNNGTCYAGITYILVDA